MGSDLKPGKVVALFATLVALSLAAAAQAQTDNQELVAKGQYVLSLAAVCACHSDPNGTPRAGGRLFPIP